MLITLLVLAVIVVAFTNGANANFKGVASLYGSGTTTLRTAAIWGTVTTFAGSLTALWLATGLLLAFRGRGIVADEFVTSADFLCAVAFGAAATSFLATRFGFPVSTTHALVGALVGVGLVAAPRVELSALGNTFLVPLFFSPVLAAMLGGIVYFLLIRSMLLPTERTPTLDILHFISTGAASFARGLNDTPKIAAPLFLVSGLEAEWGIFLVASAMALGGLLDIDRVAETLGKKVTGMNPGEGFAVSLVTASLVTTASLHSLPVSTTHVSVGSLFGMGVVAGKVYWRKVGEILFVWMSTVPCAAVLGAITYHILAWFVTASSS